MTDRKADQRSSSSEAVPRRAPRHAPCRGRPVGPRHGPCVAGRRPRDGVPGVHRRVRRPPEEVRPLRGRAGSLRPPPQAVAGPRLGSARSGGGGLLGPPLFAPLVRRPLAGSGDLAQSVRRLARPAAPLIVGGGWLARLASLPQAAPRGAAPTPLRRRAAVNSPSGTARRRGLASRSPCQRPVEPAQPHPPGLARNLASPGFAACSTAGRAAGACAVGQRPMRRRGRGRRGGHLASAPIEGADAVRPAHRKRRRPAAAQDAALHTSD